MRYGPNSPAIERYLEALRALDATSVAAFRAAWLEHLGGVGNLQATATVGKEHARAVSRATRTAVRSGLREQHAAAIQDAQTALAAANVIEGGVTIVLADLAGLLVVRDRIPPADVDVLNGPWRAVTGRDAGD